MVVGVGRLTAGHRTIFLVLAFPVFLFLFFLPCTTVTILRWVFENERAEFMMCVKHASIATGFTRITYCLLLWIDMQLCFRILTLRTKNKFFNESIQHVLQLIRLMRSIDNVTVILNIKLGLCSQLTTKYLVGYVGGRLSAFATSTMLTITVLIPFPLPSTLAIRRGIL